MTDATDAILQGRVVAAATETFFGLLADPSNPDALARLFAIKPRAEGVALILPHRAAWKALVTSIPPIAERLADAFWPGPLTIALPAATSVDTRVTVAGTVAVRVASASAAAELAMAVDRPLTATSANVHGAPPPIDSTGVERAFHEAIVKGDLLVLPGRCAGGLPSTIVGVAGEHVSLIRHGAISESQIHAALSSFEPS